MGLAKRYVKEFAADKKRILKNVAIHFDEVDLPEMAQEAKEGIGKVDKVVELCEYGYITDFEAVKQILEA